MAFARSTMPSLRRARALAMRDDAIASTASFARACDWHRHRCKRAKPTRFAKPTRARASAAGSSEDARAATATRRRALALASIALASVTSTARAQEIAGADVEARALANATFGDVELAPYVDYENGYALLSPRAWVKDLPNGMQEIEMHPVSEYGGRRFKVVIKPYGKVSSLKLADLDGEEYASPEAYAYAVASKYAPVAEEGREVGRGVATCKILSARSSDDGRYYFYEYVTENSMLPLHFWGVVGLGPGPVGSARKLGRKDLVTLVTQMPEEKGPEAAALMAYIITTFRIIDV